MCTKYWLMYDVIHQEKQIKQMMLARNITTTAMLAGCFNVTQILKMIIC